MKIYLCAREEDLFDACKLHCDNYEFVTVTKQDIMSIPAEAVVSPANSFGFMTGGIDLHYRNFFGISVEKDLKDRIAIEFNNELCIGQSTSVKIPNDESKYFSYKYLIAAPTMRMPENISFTINAFLAVKAALMEAIEIGVESVVFPGMGTGTGSMSAGDSAKQVSAAIRYVIIEERSYALPSSLYEEQDYIRKYVVADKWYETQVS